jgi:NADP-dependent aldehyde dehydrogenase
VRHETPVAETSAALYEATLDRADSAARLLAETTPTERATWLDAIADALDAASSGLVPVAVAETHLGTDRLSSEVKRTTFQLRLHAGVLREGSFLGATIDHADPDWPPAPRPDIRRVLRAIGPVAVYAASNFPFAFSVAGGDTASALAAANPVIVKVHPGHPTLSAHVGELVTAALRDRGAPDGTFGLVSGLETGRRLITDPRIRAGAFTGSLRGGRALFDLAVSRPDPIPFYGELGSLNPAFVTATAAAERAEQIADGFVASLTLGVGQFCTKPGVLFAPADSGLPTLIAERLAAVAGAPMLNDGLRAGYGEMLAELAGRPGVTVLAGSATPGADPEPTALEVAAGTFLDEGSALAVEVFGPAALIVRYRDDAELLACAASFDGQLTATIHGTDGDRVVPPLLAELTERAGRVLWNGWPTGVAVTDAQHHGGPYPATTAVRETSVGTAAISRFLRPVAYQGLPDELLPPALREANPWGLPRRVDGVLVAPGDRPAEPSA